MSCSSSQYAQTPPDYHDSLSVALVDVAEGSFFAFVDPCEPVHFNELARGVRSWIQASVLFDGPFGGAVLVVVTEPLARSLFSAFLGTESDVVPMESALFDLLGEFSNMVCGHWLTRSCQHGRFDLRHPEVARLHRDQLTPDPSDCVLFAINDEPCYVRLALSGDSECR